MRLWCCESFGLRQSFGELWQNLELFLLSGYHWLVPFPQLAATSSLTRAEGLLIRLRVRQQEENAVVEVIDQGPGIAPQHQQKIFERFYRVDKARSRTSGGAGLGLSIARWAIQRQGGHVELESELGRGSLFRIVMPR